MHNDQTTSALLKTEFQKFKIKLSHDHVNRLIRHHILKFWKILLTTKYMHVCTKLYTVYIRSQYIKSPYILRWLNHIQQKMKCIEKYKLVSPETEFAHTHSLNDQCTSWWWRRLQKVQSGHVSSCLRRCFHGHDLCSLDFRKQLTSFTPLAG